MRSSRIRFEPIEQGGPGLSPRTLAPHDLERRPRGVRMLHGFDERLCDIGAGDAVPWRQWQGVLSDDDRVLPGGPIEQKADADDRVVKAAGANVIFNAPAPGERVPL